MIIMLGPIRIAPKKPRPAAPYLSNSFKARLLLGGGIFSVEEFFELLTKKVENQYTGHTSGGCHEKDRGRRSFQEKAKRNCLPFGQSSQQKN